MKTPTAIQLPSGNWCCRVMVDGKSACVTRDSEKLAVADAIALKAGLKEAKKRPKKTTLSEAIDLYIAAKVNLSPSTLRGYDEIKRNRFQSYMDSDVYKMAEADWQAACNEESKLCSPKTLKNAWGFISAVLHRQIGRRYEVSLPTVVKNKRPFLDYKQIKIFLEAVKGQRVEIPALLGLCSLRQSEILGLRWSDIDLDRKLITVSGSAVRNKDGKLIRKNTNKNETSQRIVPILIPQLLDVLTSAPKDVPMVVNLSFNVLFKDINKICGSSGLPEIGVHGLRHSFASLAYHLQIPEKVAMEIGGWSDSKTMHDIYTHIAQYDVSERVEQMTKFYSADGSGSLEDQIIKKDEEINSLKRQLEDLQKRYDILSDVSNQFTELFRNFANQG